MSALINSTKNKMKIENYKGIDIFHNAEKDEFVTKIVVLPNSKKDSTIRNGRLQKVRDEIDRFLNTAAKKPVLKKAWVWKDKYNDESGYVKADILIFNCLTNNATIQREGFKATEDFNLTPYWNSDKKVFICCKENDAIIAQMNKDFEAIAKIKKQRSCASGKLIPLAIEHFK